MPEWTYSISLADLADGPIELTLEADGPTKVPLARRFDLLALETLTATVRAERAGAGMRIDGRVRGAVTQSCVVTGEPVAGEIDEHFSVLFLPEREVPAAADEALVDIEAAEDIEPLVGDSVDIGEVAAQSLALALDPYPRSTLAPPPGEAGSHDPREEQASAESESPFAVLKNLRDMT